MNLRCLRTRETLTRKGAVMAASRIPKLPSQQPTRLPVLTISRMPLYQCRFFSASPVTTRQHKRTGRRRAMESWIRGKGAVFKKAKAGTTNYVSGYDINGNPNLGPSGQVPKNPFPLNPYFRSQPVLTESIRDAVYKRVIERGQTTREVSVDFGITMERVGAVARMMSIEQEWQREGKPLNRGYQKTVLDMLPQTRWDEGKSLPSRHEHINDLPVHSSTLPQIFQPAPESRAFSRKEAAKIFDPNLLPPDDRIPHPEMIEYERDALEGYKQSERRTRLRERILATEARRLEAEKKQKEREEKQTKTVEGVRWSFRFKDVNVDHVGKSGRGRHGVGWRYGAPHEDRKRGSPKIPTKVE